MDRLVHATYISCLNNLSVCYLSQNELVKAKELCVKVLEVEPFNMRALTMAAKVMLLLHVSK